MNSVRNLSTQVVLDGNTIPVIGWQCHLTSYGNLCTFEVHTSIKELKNLGIEIYKIAQKDSEVECKIILSDNTNGQSQVVFDGIVDSIECTWEHDEVEICGRDYSAVLRDQIGTLDDYVQQTTSQVVKSICDRLKIKTSIVDSNIISGVKVNAFQGEDWSFVKSPQPLWKIIQELADETDYVAYMDAQKTLHFEPPGIGKSHQYFWRPSPTSVDITQNPVMNLSILQQARKCANFTLRLTGYDRDGKLTIYKEDKVGDGSGQFYHKNRQDLNAQNVDSLWASIADEIQRKNIVAKLVVEGDTTLHVNDQLQLTEIEPKDLLGMSDRQLFIVSIVHSFSMPDYGSSEGDGFLTHITCNQLTGGNA